ncbi:MAG: hypothetical protein ACRCWU_00055 [Metamycoplasmataceae bacterium]
MKLETAKRSKEFKSSSKKLRVFEAFAGIGAQHKALQFLKDKYGYDYEVVGISEWDVDAQISYAAIHYPKYETMVKDVSDAKMNKYLAQFDHSFSGKDLTPIEKIISMDPIRKKKYYKAHVISKNMGSILRIKGGGVFMSLSARLT